ncbi:MAG: secretin N-terminal domain-containing protein [Pseudomonadota bacterium]
MAQIISRFFLALSLALICKPVLAETEFKIITLQHRFANDLLPTITPMVGLDGTATGIDNQLILRAQPERMREIEAIIEKLDATRVNRRITVSNSLQQDSQSATTEASGTVILDTGRAGNVTISNTKRRQMNGGNIVIERNTSSTRQTGNQFINVLDGERAFISSGQIVPFTQEWLTITRRYIQIDRVSDWREVTTGFAVRPRTIGNLVEVEVTPRISSINQQGFIDFEELSTVVRLNLGEWLDIGGTMQNKDEISRKILGSQSISNSLNSRLLIKVD